MSTARQVIRWSIPGAVFILVVILYEIPVAIALGAPEHYVSDRIATVDLTPVVALSIFASIAFGYLIYQFYFSLYGMVSLPIVRITRADRGLAILWHLARGEDLNQDQEPAAELKQSLQKQIGDLLGAVTDLECFTETKQGSRFLRLKDRTLPTMDNPKGEVLTRRRAIDAQRVNWSATKSLLDLVTTEHESGHVHQEYTTLSDIYHSLGASIVASTLALAVNAVANVGFYDNRWSAPGWKVGVAVIAIVAIWVTLTGVFVVNRRNAFRDSQNTLMFGLRFHTVRQGLLVVNRELNVPVFARGAGGQTVAPDTK